MTKLQSILILVVGLVSVVVANYAMALAGEPRAVWLFRDILGII